MPIAIVLSETDVIPAILVEADAHQLVAQLRALRATPATVTDEETARVWLQTLPEPSGWFTGMAEANAHLDRMAREPDMTPAEIAAARESLGLTRVALAEAVGIGGNDNTRHKRMWEIEQGQARLNPTATRRLRALLARKAIQA